MARLPGHVKILLEIEAPAQELLSFWLQFTIASTSANLHAGNLPQQGYVSTTKVNVPLSCFRVSAKLFQSW